MNAMVQTGNIKPQAPDSNHPGTPPGPFSPTDAAEPTQPTPQTIQLQQAVQEQSQKMQQTFPWFNTPEQLGSTPPTHMEEQTQAQAQGSLIGHSQHISQEEQRNFDAAVNAGQDEAVVLRIKEMLFHGCRQQVPPFFPCEQSY